VRSWIERGGKIKGESGKRGEGSYVEIGYVDMTADGGHRGEKANSL